MRIALFLNKKLIIISLVIFGIISCQFLYRYYGINYSAVFTLIQNHPVIAPFLFILMYIIGVVSLVPSLPLNLGAGVLFGGIWGGIWATVGSTLGSLVAFLLARGLPRIRQYRFFNNKYVGWINNEIQKNEWRLVAFSRLCSALPTGLVNYLFGFTNIRFSVYAWATLIFLFPPSLIVSIIGQHLGTYLLNGNNVSILHETFIVLSCLALLIFVVPFIFHRLCKLNLINKSELVKLAE